MRKLRAYIAYAMTSTNGPIKRRIERTLLSVERTCHRRQIATYIPGRYTDPWKHARLRSRTVYRTDHDNVLKSDLVILLGDVPSFGAGMEVEIARTGLIPIIAVTTDVSELSRMVRGIPNLVTMVTYQTPSQLEKKLDGVLLDQARALSDPHLQKNPARGRLVSTSLRAARRSRSMSRAKLASLAGLSLYALTQLEKLPDPVSNPSLAILQALAKALDMDIAELLTGKGRD